MKKTLLLIIALLIAGKYNVHAQTTRVEKYGVILTSDDSSKGWYLQNTTSNSLTVFVANHQDKVENLSRNVMIVSSGKHQEAHFIIAPGEKKDLGGIICYHSIGLYIGKKDNAHLISQQFYAKN